MAGVKPQDSQLFGCMVDDDDDDDDDADYDVDDVSSAVDMHKLVLAGGGGILRISDIGHTSSIFYIPYRTKIKQILMTRHFWLMQNFWQ